MNLHEILIKDFIDFTLFTISWVYLLSFIAQTSGCLLKGLRNTEKHMHKKDCFSDEKVHAGKRKLRNGSHRRFVLNLNECF